MAVTADNRNASSKPLESCRLIPTVVDEVAATDPEREFFSIPRSSKASDGWRKLTFGQLADGINRVAAQLLERHRAQTSGSATTMMPVSRTSYEYTKKFPTLAYIGPTDVRYQVFMVACIKAGCKALLISPRNSIEAQLNLFEKTECVAIYCDAGFEDRARAWAAGHRAGMETFRAGSVDEWLGVGMTPAPVVPYLKTFEQARWDPFMVLHTSGSTGLPKPVVVRAGLMALSETITRLPEFRGTVPTWAALFGARRLFAPMPFFHAAGAYMPFIWSVYLGIRVALPIADRPLTPQAVIDAAEYADVDCALLPPTILEGMSHIPEGVDCLRKMRLTIFVGGPLARDIGNKLVENGARIQAFIGSTETGTGPFYQQQNDKLWEWFIINSEVMGADWRPAGETDEGPLFEMVIVRKDPMEPGIQAVFYTFPEATEFKTNDIYIKHPTLPDHWKHYGRADDVLVFSNGEKLNPVTIEKVVASHPGVKGALVVGQGRFQAALFIEPATAVGDDEAQAFIDRVWPTIERVNQETVTHGRIVRQLVALTRPDKPLPRAGKGTVQRAAATKLYEKETAELFERVDLDEEDEASGQDKVPIDISSTKALAGSIADVFTRVAGLGAKGEPLTDDTDFFSVGIDSLQVITASRIIHRGLKAATGREVDADAVAPRIVYSNPTTGRLASHLMKTVVGGGEQQNGVNGHHDSDSALMQALLDKYTQNLPDPEAQRGKPEARSQGQTVIVTGTTGGLGSYLLDIAQADPSISKVICLNRSADAAERQAQSNADKGLDTRFAKVEFLHADVSKPDFGLGAETYNRLLGEVDRVVHNAWPVNFNHSLGSFEPSIHGVRNFIDFSASCARRVPIVFISSIATVEGWNNPSAPVPERSLRDFSLASMGYGQSKLVGSLILDEARERSAIPGAVVRVGQIAGPRAEKGAWTRQEWFPTLIRSSLHLGLLPASLGGGIMERVDWAPVEDVAKLVLEVADVLPRRKGWKPEERGDAVEGYFHGVNPRLAQWTTLLAPAVQQLYGGGPGGRIREIVPFADWVAALERSVATTRTTDEIARNPAVKLLNFYRGMAKGGVTAGAGYEVTRTVGISPTFAELEAVTPELMQNWCSQWRF